MSADWVMDIADMHAKFGVNDWQQFYKNDKELMQKYIAFRMAMIQEEIDQAFVNDLRAKADIDFNSKLFAN